MANFVSSFEKWGRRRCRFRPSWHYCVVMQPNNKRWCYYLEYLMRFHRPSMIDVIFAPCQRIESCFSCYQSYLKIVLLWALFLRQNLRLAHSRVSSCTFCTCSSIHHSHTVVKRGHTEGIEREKTSSQNSQGIALDFWIDFSHSNRRVEYNWRAIPAKCKCPHILI